MKLSKNFIVLGACLALGLPLAFSSMKENPVTVKAADTRTFEIEFNFDKINKYEIMQTYIGQFKIGFNFLYNNDPIQIFNTSPTYINDHLDERLDANGQPLKIADGLIINGKSIREWANYNKTNEHHLVYSTIDNVQQFPMSTNSGGYVFSAVNLMFETTGIELRLNLEVFPMDDIEVTFKKDFFKGYFDGHSYELAEDVTYYSEINSDAPAAGNPKDKITFVKERNERLVNLGIENIHVSSQKTANKGGLYHYYQIFTQIERDQTRVNGESAVPTDHDRYIYSNILLNGLPLTHYNAWARANKKDFSSINWNSPASSVQNADYETGHATGSINPRYDLAARAEIAVGTNDINYIITVYLPDQLLVDVGITDPVFELREGSSWFSKDSQGNPIIVRISQSAFVNYIAEKCEELDNYPDFSLYRAEEVATIGGIISAAKGDIYSAASIEEIDAIVLEAKADIDAVPTATQIAEQEHIAAVEALIDAIPNEIVDNEECVNAINAAKEAYALLTNSEKSHVAVALVEKLINADAALEALKFEEYKQLVLDQINAEVDPDLYRTEQKNTILELLSEAYLAIDAATDMESVDIAYDSLIAAVAPVPLASVLAKAELEAIDLTVYRTEQREQFEALIAQGKALIDQCKTADDVDRALARVLALIAKVKTSEEMDLDVELTPARETAKEELLQYANAKGRKNYSALNWEQIMDYVDLGNLAIDTAMSEEAIATALADAKANIDTVEKLPPDEIPDDKPSKKSGCGGSVVATSVVLSILSVAGLGLVSLKKREK